MRTSRSEGGLAGWKAVGVAALVVAGVGLRAVNRMNRRNPSRTEEAQLAEQEEAARQATGAQISLNEMTDAMQLPHPAKIERGDDFVIADVARIPTIAGHAWGAVGAAPLATSRSETTGSRYVGVADDGESKVILEIDEGKVSSDNRREFVDARIPKLVEAMRHDGFSEIQPDDLSSIGTVPDRLIASTSATDKNGATVQIGVGFVFGERTYIAVSIANSGMIANTLIEVTTELTEPTAPAE